MDQTAPIRNNLTGLEGPYRIAQIIDGSVYRRINFRGEEPIPPIKRIYLHKFRNEPSQTLKYEVEEEDDEVSNDYYYDHADEWYDPSECEIPQNGFVKFVP